MSTYPIDIAPSVLDVAALLRARTKDSNGMEVGTFNDDTRPTSAQVLTLIDQAVADVQAWLGPKPAAGARRGREGRCVARGRMPDRAELLPRAGALAAQRVPEYKELLDDKTRQLQEAARGLQPGGSTVTSTRIEVPWIDFIPPAAVPLVVADSAEAA
jgi:hypothetical protein